MKRTAIAVPLVVFGFKILEIGFVKNVTFLPANVAGV